MVRFENVEGQQLTAKPVQSRPDADLANPETRKIFQADKQVVSDAKVVAIDFGVSNPYESVTRGAGESVGISGAEKGAGSGAESGVSKDVQRALKETIDMMGPGGTARAEKILEDNLAEAKLRYGDKSPRYNEYLEKVSAGLKQAGVSDELAVGWAKAHAKEYEYIKQDGALSMQEINLGLQIKDGKDPMAVMMLGQLKDNYSKLSSEKFDYDNTAPSPMYGQRPLVDGITTNDMNSYLSKRDKQMLADWKTEQAAGSDSAKLDVNQTVREAMTVAGPGGIEVAAKRIESDMAEAKEKLGDKSPVYKQYLEQLSAELQRFPDFSSQVAVAWAKNHAKDYDYVTKDGNLSRGELNIAEQITDGKDPFAHLMLTKLQSQYDALKKQSYDTYTSGTQTTPWGTRVSSTESLDAISAKDMNEFLSKTSKSLRKAWEKEHDA